MTPHVRRIALLLALAFQGAAWADEASPTAPPNPYLVQSGDTLWGIAERFLKDPWRWPDVWENNPHFGDPHRIYPGDKVYFYVDGQGQPHLRINQPPPEEATAKGKDLVLTPDILLSPPVRQEQILSNRQKELINQFLQRHTIIADNPLEADNYIVAETAGHQIIGPGDTLFLKIQKGDVAVGDSLAIYRTENEIRSLDGKEMLGHMTTHLGMVRVERITPEGPVGVVTNAFNDIQPGDRLVTPHPINIDFKLYTDLTAKISGHVLQIFDNLEGGGTNQMVVLDIGRRQKATQGLILNIMRRGREVDDPLNPPNWSTGVKPLQFPDEKIGTAVLIYLGEQSSIALLTQTFQPVRAGDRASLH